MKKYLSLALLLGCMAYLGGCKAESTGDSTSTSSSSATGGANSGSGQNPIHVVGFDEHDETLQAILDGQVHGTVVQNPYMYGYKSMELLKKLVDGEPAPTGDDVFIDLPTRKITVADAAEFWKDKNEKLAAGAGEVEFKAGRQSYAYVTNGIDPFWVVAAAGAIKAGRDLDINILIRNPPKGIGDQQTMLEGLLVQDDVVGVAVSPIDPSNQQEILNRIGNAKKFVTHDSDAPNTNRLAYIGTENYNAGRLAGELVKEAMPEGGSVMIFVGRLGQLNAEQRRQGLIDELLNRAPDPNRRDPNDKEIIGEKYTILGTKLDNFDKAKAKQNAQDAISKYPDLGCMVGLFAYNPPLCLQAIREAGREVRAAAK
jgi:ABC-type sugar transport system substrate-binding protein